MPKWTDYTTKTTVADNDEIMTLDTAGKTNKRLSLSTLSDWVLGKIADKVFEKLQTNNKTILGAINELNSNRLREYNWRAYDDIISAMNAEKNTILIQGSSIFSATTNGGHPYMVILSVSESRDAVGAYIDYFKSTVTTFRYKNESFEIII